MACSNLSLSTERSDISMTAIDVYIDELAVSLRGPRRAKADLLTEARDSLVDAAESFEQEGLAREAAERRAIDEFGRVPEIVPDYQAELGLSQARGTALTVLFVFAAQPIVWGVWGSLPHERTDDPGTIYAFASELVEWLGGAAIIGALLIVGACGIGIRYLSLGRRFARVTAVFGFTVAGVFATLGLLLTLLTPEAQARSLTSVSGVPWTVAFLMLPLAVVGVSARRCLDVTHA